MDSVMHPSRVTASSRALRCLFRSQRVSPLISGLCWKLSGESRPVLSLALPRDTRVLCAGCSAHQKDSCQNLLSMCFVCDVRMELPQSKQTTVIDWSERSCGILILTCPLIQVKLTAYLSYRYKIMTPVKIMHVIIQDPKANEVNYVCAFVHVGFLQLWCTLQTKERFNAGFKTVSVVICCTCLYGMLN